MSTMRRGIRRSAFLLVAALGVASVSCGGGGDGGTGPGGGGGATITRIDVTPQTADVFVGKTATYTATAKDADGATVTGKTIVWSSSNTTIATVSGGVVTAVGPGSATIRATVGAVEGQAAVHVFAPVATVELVPATATIIIGATQQLTATLKDAAGNVLTDRTVTWTSDNDLIASVSSTGLVTSKSVGSATITATVEGKSATAKVTITPVPVASVSITPATSSLVIGSTVQLSATTKDEAGNTLTGRTVTWTTSDASIASVDANGLVTAHAVGTATITATSETKTATAQITVTEAPVATVAVNPSSVSLALNGTRQLTATTSDANGQVLTGRVVTWSSSDPAKATVDANGLVTGLAYGQVTITATSEGKTGTATVSVSDGSAPVLVGLTLVPNPVDVTAGTKTVTATAHITDAGGAGVSQFAITATAPHGAFTNCVDTTRDSGTASDGTWSCTLTVPIGAEPGDWALVVLVSDAGYSSKMYGSADLVGAGLPGSFNVISTWDQKAPVFTSLTVTPTSVNVANGAQTITVSAGLTDDRSGIAQFDFYATSPSGQQVGCSATTPATGTTLNGTWTCTLTVPADAEAGTWLITVRATDQAFNYQTYGPQPDGKTNIAFPAGYPTTITVTR
jgi:uncharacterized protein YjdB